ncbi:Holliday junction resolvase RuvX [Marinivivus vitaminiproducens]|uniref:Holliday junction resolvase RuvX n=1 Tax=Marinivivus vitaminiproducens TaxID=3035935 RepID=UPI0027A097B4|nr:Holliday junction resolvase RuvX [Geminicoccaceae bacterium SCSIO 64248]
MTISGNIEAFTGAWPGKGSLLGLDLGERSLGIAGSDASNLLATPIRTLSRRKVSTDFPELERLLALRDATGFVLGWPVSMDGREGPRCKATRRYAGILVERFVLPVLLWDERLSSFAAEELYEEITGRRPPQGERIDHFAAAHILQEALDALRRARA